MKPSVFARTVFLLLSFGLATVPTLAQASTNDAPLTNKSVLKLVKANFKEKTIIAIVGSRPTRFDLSTEAMIVLKKAGVSERIILAMIAHQQGLDMSLEAGDDDVFFDERPDKPKPDSPAQPGASADVFGSSGGIRGTTKSNGGNSSVTGDTVTTGSATVRIMRPPAEAEGSPKLLKIPTLTNESIMDLVDAGFSEGTIIRRIEQSPVEFDLSPAKLADLRKRRVSEKVLLAMKVAMGDGGNPRTSSDSNATPRG